MEKQIYKPHIKCRACGSEKLTKYLDFGLHPLPNHLFSTREESLNTERYPLEAVLCEDCGLSQLSIVVDPEKMFSYYTYRSSVNGGYIKHCRQMAKDLKDRYELDENSLVVDIASNDGALLKEFKDEIGCKVLGVDPSKNLAKIANEEGIPTLPEFWGEYIATQIELKYGKADVVTGTNVFAHVDCIQEFLEAAKILLKPEGVLIIECPYIGDHIEKMEFTQFYHEHLSYMSVSPIYDLCKKLDLELIDVEKQEIHGGTIRMTIAHKGAHGKSDSVGRYLDDEYDKKYLALKTYNKWAESVAQSLISFRNFVKYGLHGYVVAAFSASAKGSTLLNSSGLDYKNIQYIVDDTPEKQNKYSPGTGIPIVPIDRLIDDAPDFLILLSWNFADSIMEKCRKAGYKGKFVIPIPKLEIV